MSERESPEPAIDPAVEPAEPPPGRSRREALVARVKALVRAIQENDEDSIERAILRLSKSRRIFAPLAFALGAFLLVFDGVKLLLSNWRLTLIQILPAMWIWLAMADVKAHVLRGKTFHVLRGPILLPLGLLVIGITVAAFFLNAAFAFAVAQPGSPQIRPAFTKARQHHKPIGISGTIVGLMLAIAVLVAPRWGRPWFTIALGAVIGVMMVCYVAVPGRLIGAKPIQSRRDKLATTAIGGALSVMVCTPPYMMARIGLLMLGSSWLLIPGIILLSLGATLQAGATGAVRAIKMSATLTVTRRAAETAGDEGPAAQGAAAEGPGAGAAGPERAGPEAAGAEGPGAERAGAEAAGAEGPGAERAGAEARGS